MLNIKEIVEASNGRLIRGNETDLVKSYKIDSREVQEGDFFIPIVGEKVDAHKFIINCLKNKIAGFFINENNQQYKEIIEEAIEINSNINIIEVKDTEQALFDIAKYNRIKHIDVPIVAVTGSVGKTSTREMIASVLRTHFNDVLVTEKNYNSCIGTPLMILKLESQDICVLEIGIDTFGEMTKLSELVKPDIAVITNIGTSHIAILKSRENIFKEKSKIVEYLKGYSKLIINGDNDYLQTLESNDKYTVEKNSLNECNNIKIDDEKIEFYTNIYDKICNITINQIGEHNIYNALCAIKVGQILNISETEIITGINNYKNFNKRLEKKIICDNIIIIDDTYNASIDSMKSGLITVDKLKGNRKFAVLGDMLELGEYSEELHSEVGKTFKNIKFDYLYTFGEYAKYINEAAKDYILSENNIHFDTKDKIIEAIKLNMKSNDIIYFKASNGMKFFEMINKLVEEYSTDK